MVGYAGGSLYACQQNETTEPPYRIEKEQQAICQQSSDEHAATCHMDTDSPAEVEEGADKQT